MNSKLYVGNLAWAVEEKELETVFGNYGEVLSVKIIKDRDTGRSKGFSFVEMESADAAQAAIEGLDGTDLGGRNLKVNIAQDRPKRERNFNSSQRRSW
tara:strand:- start:27 stop:320 length:294 start_codon:yes stop_codon:yes gene_type:complete